MEKKETSDEKVASVLNRLNLKHNKLAGELRVRSKLQVITVQVTSSARTRGDGLGREVHGGQSPQGVTRSRGQEGHQAPKAQGDGVESWTLRHPRRSGRKASPGVLKEGTEAEALRHVAAGWFFYLCHSRFTGAVTLSLARRGWRKMVCTQLRLWARGPGRAAQCRWFKDPPF